MEYSVDINKQSVNINKLKTIGNKDRIRILNILMNKPMSWTELQNQFDMNPNTLNYHLTRLIHSGFIARDIVPSENDKPGTKYSILEEGERYYNLSLKEV